MRINRRPKALRVASIVAVLAMVLAACGGGSGGDTTTTAGADTGSDGGSTGLLKELQDSGTVTVGIANEIPYGYEDEATGEITGEAPEVAKRVLSELGIDNMEAKVVEFGALIAGLQAGNFDMIAAGMYINADRAEQIIFSDPDYCINESMLVAEGNPFGLTNYNSVADTDAKLAVASGTVNVDYAHWAGIPDDQIVEFAGIEDQYDALSAGRVDAVSGTVLTVTQHADVMNGFEALPSFPALDQDGNPILGCGGFGFMDQGFRDAFNNVLNDLQDQGVVQDIVAEHLGSREVAEDAVDMTVSDLTGG
ncbi:MAG: ectoine/hydroxyectoine ABC transporter substrate-binding protein EhuB [Acidimicrobiia bacterium]